MNNALELLVELVAATDAQDDLRLSHPAVRAMLDADHAVAVGERLDAAWTAVRAALRAGPGEQPSEAPNWTFDTAFAAGIEAGKSMCGERDHQWAPDVAAVDGREALLNTAHRIIQQYANENPCWTASGSTQDPMGAHAWLASFVVLAPRSGAAGERGGSEHSVAAPVQPLPLGDLASRGAKP